MTISPGAATRLESRGQIWRFADRVPLLMATRLDQFADHHHPCRDADMDLEPDPGRTCQCTHALDRRQTGPHGALGVVFVRSGIAEIDEDAIAQVPSNEPVKALHGRRDTLPVGGNQIAQILRIEAGREARRSDEIAKHHCQLAALRTAGARRRRLTSRSWRRGFGSVRRELDPAFAAEVGTSRVRGSASRAERTYGCTACSAEFRTIGIVMMAVSAFHQGPTGTCRR